jgi:hypothetical protein
MNPRAQKLTAPKPDFTYAFPIIDTTRKENLSYMRFSQADSFTLPVLGRLRKEYGLKSAPTTRLQMWAAENDVALDAADLICFPWAVVEAKRNKKTETPDIKFKKYNRKVAGTNKSMERFCYCQAANASAEALTLREELAAKAKEQSESHYALVIISITCVGSSIKVWITYRRNSVSVPILLIQTWHLKTVRIKTVASKKGPLLWFAYGRLHWS